MRSGAFEIGKIFQSAFQLDVGCVTLQTLSTFPAWTVVELHGTVVSHTVVT